MRRETLLAVDGNNLLMRSMKAAEGKGVELSHGGVNTAPLTLFIPLLAKYVRAIQPDRVVVAFDGGASLRRLAIYSAYKAHRPQRSADGQDEETGAFALAKEWLSLANVFHVEQPHYEADDLIGYYWRKCHNMDLVILSGDKDLLQLVGPDCYQIRPQQGFTSIEDEKWDDARVTTEIAAPDKLAVLKALQGDTSDNIKGVPGVGPKRAVQIARESEWSIDKMRYHHKVGEEHLDLVKRNFDLVDLRNVRGVDLPVPPPFEPTTPDSMLWSTLDDFYSRYAMNNMRSRGFTLWKD